MATDENELKFTKERETLPLFTSNNVKLKAFECCKLYLRKAK